MELHRNSPAFEGARETADVQSSTTEKPGVWLQRRRDTSRARRGQARDIRRALQGRGAIGADDAHRIAGQGVSGSGGALPHGEAIQAAFGRHDISNVQAHVGGRAADASAALGASAYATGQDVAFAQNPDLHTAAHEAAHVVQQRQGVSLKGGVGQEGDVYERHADAVADRVVQGRSAEGLLDRGPGGAGGAGGVQRRSNGEAVQFEDGPMCGPDGQTVGGTSPDQSTGPGSDLNLVTGAYTQVNVTARIPIGVPGLTLDVSLTGKYTEGSEGANRFIEAEGVAQISLSYRLLFLRLSVFLRGGLKFKVRNSSGWNAAFNAACEDISHWVAASHLSDLPAKKGEVSDEYDDFIESIRSEFSWIRGDSSSERHGELSTESDGWFNDSALTNILQARTALIDGVRDVFSDLGAETTVIGSNVYPNPTWIVSQVNAHSEGETISRTQFYALRDRLIAEANGKNTQMQASMDNVPALANNPDVEFEANVQMGVDASINVTDNAEASIQLGAGLRITDGMGDTTFDTSARTVYFASASVSGTIGSTSITGQLAYEGVGERATEPDQVKVSGQVLAGVADTVEDPEAYGSTLTGVRDRLMRAGRGAAAGGQAILGAIRTSLVREMQQTRGPRWSNGGSSRAGFAVELKFKRNAAGEMVADSVKVEFVSVTAMEAQAGVLSGSIETGTSVGLEVSNLSG